MSTGAETADENKVPPAAPTRTPTEDVPRIHPRAPPRAHAASRCFAVAHHRQGRRHAFHPVPAAPAADHPPRPLPGVQLARPSAQELRGPRRDLHEVRPDHRLVAGHVRRRGGRRVPRLPRHRARRSPFPDVRQRVEEDLGLLAATRPSPSSIASRSGRRRSPWCTGPGCTTGVRWRSRCCGLGSSTWWRPTSTSCSR